MGVGSIASGLFYLSYSNSIRTELDFIVFNFGLFFLFLLVPIIVIIKNRRLRKCQD